MSYLRYRSDVKGINTFGDYCKQDPAQGLCITVTVTYESSVRGIRVTETGVSGGWWCPSDPLLYDGSARGIKLGSAVLCTV